MTPDEVASLRDQVTKLLDDGWVYEQLGSEQACQHVWTRTSDGVRDSLIWDEQGGYWPADFNCLTFICRRLPSRVLFTSDSVFTTGEQALAFLAHLGLIPPQHHPLFVAGFNVGAQRLAQVQSLIEDASARLAAMTPLEAGR